MEGVERVRGDLFATAETFPKGRFLDYPAEWGTTNVSRIEALDMNFESQPAGGEGAILAELKRATVQQRAARAAVLVAALVPRRRGDEDRRSCPPYEPGCHDDPSWGMNPNATYDCDWDDSAHIDKMGWIGLKETSGPAAHKMLKAYTLDNATQEKLMHQVDVEGEDALKAVNAWLDANESTWKPWTM